MATRMDKDAPFMVARIEGGRVIVGDYTYTSYDLARRHARELNAQVPNWVAAWVFGEQLPRYVAVSAPKQGGVT